jgi:hypothetical protein
VAAARLTLSLPLLAAVGAKTHRIENGAAAIDMRYENPLYMAEDAGETAHARTRGTGVLVYGDFEFCVVEVMAKPVRRCRWWGLGEGDFSPDRPRIVNRLRLIFSPSR